MIIIQLLLDYKWEAISGILLLYVISTTISDPHGLKRIPGPPLTSICSLWALIQARLHKYSRAVHAQHEKYGDFVRISPNHVSIGGSAYIKDVMGHGNGFTKSDFYQIFDWHSQSVFTTRSREVHARKRKWLSHTFSSRAISGFEPFMSNNLRIYGKQMENLIEGKPAGRYEFHLDPEMKSRQAVGEGALDATEWNAFLAFDMIGDLAFGGSFGYTQNGFDANNGIRVLKERGEWCVVAGQMPWMRKFTPYMFFDPFLVKGAKAVSDLGDMCTAAVNRRKNRNINRKDILSCVLEARDPDTGQPLEDDELIMESLSIFIGGSDTTSNTITHAIDLLSRHPEKLQKLHRELDTAFPDPLPEDFVPEFSEIKALPYLNAVVFETLRLRPTIAFGLPRVVPPGPGVTIGGNYFKPGTNLSISTYTVHRDREIFGEDAMLFNPDRWLDGTRGDLEKYFMSFSYGPRACVGRNIALMELKKTVTTFFRRFNYRLIYPEQETQIREGFHLKCSTLPVFISKRTADQTLATSN